MDRFIGVEQYEKMQRCKYVAAWRARQTKAHLQELRRAEYLRNRERRLVTAKAYKRAKL